MAEAAPDRPLERAYRIELFAEQDAVGNQDVIAFWAREGAVIGEGAEQRVHEVLLVATHESGELVGVSSAYLSRNLQLGMDLWHYRAFVAKEHRMSNIAVNLGVIGRNHLERRFVSGEDPRAAGMIFEIENEGVKRRHNRAVLRATDFAFIGENARGDHVRVRYFPGALAPAPPR
jgi:hypothetical protein